MKRRSARGLLLALLVGAPAWADPQDANKLFNEGLRLMQSIEGQLRSEQLNDDEQAIAQQAHEKFVQAIALAPNHGRAHIMLGMLCKFTAAYDEAVPHLKVGMQLPAGSQDWWIAADTLVNVYFAQDLPAPALPILEQIVKYRTDDANAFYKLGLAYAGTKKKAQAKKAFKKALALNPDSAEAKEQLALLEQAK